MDLEDIVSLDDTTPEVGQPSDVDPFGDVPSSVCKALKERGFTELTSVQRAVLDTEVEGHDLQISSQTGSGKTVALGFVLAPKLAAERGGKGPDALIIVPTRELATQVCNELTWLMADLDGVRLASVTGGTPLYRDREILSRRPRLLVGTPGRLLDHVRNGVLDLTSVSELVLDEADQMLDMGFREELEGILDATPEERRTHLVSATFPRGIQQLAARYQRDAVSIEGTRLGDANQDIEHEGYLVNARDRYDALVNLLLFADDDRTLVFVERRAEAVQVAERLEADGFDALPLSGELAQVQRARTMDAFRRGKVKVLVATDVAARGLDVPDVGTVIHTAPCIDGQVYTHRSGRTGRAGQRGRSVLLAPPNRRYKVTRMLDEARVELKWPPLPKAAEIKKKVNARAYEKLREELDAALAEGSSDRHLAQAGSLLTGSEPEALVAALLARLEPKRRAQPKDLNVPHTSKDSYKKNGYQNGHSNGHQNGHKGSFGKQNRGGKGPANTMRFFINRGMKQGATPGRILAELCRRGKVNGGDIGSIAIHPNASTFDVRAEVSVSFEENAARRDSRDPNTLIRRDRGPMPSAEKSYKKKPYSSKPSGSKPAAKKPFKREGRTKLRSRSLRR
jgi:ATP-dependent RNA helicase DeaD